jgi:sugar phosphate isomerase/epimerase
MRLGGKVFQQWSTPDEWAQAVVAAGYRAAYCPVTPGVDSSTIRAYETAAARAGIVIAEVGAWSNPLSPDPATRRTALDKCKQSLALADAINACCCVNIAGSRGQKWDGPHPADLTADTFDMIVTTVRDIIDSVKPSRTFYTLETMPWMYPDSVDSYLHLLQAIDRRQFAAHLDPVNLVCSPQLYFNNAALLRDCFARLGPYIRSCHAKDILLQPQLTTHLDEVRPGLGTLDYGVYLRELNKLDAGIPLMIEHLSEEDAFVHAADYIRAIAAQENIAL